jgi:hypothetical protein
MASEDRTRTTAKCRVASRFLKCRSGRAIGHASETQTFGEMLAVPCLLEDDPGDDIAYRRLGLDRQAVRHQPPGAFDLAQLRAASRHYGGHIGTAGALRSKSAKASYSGAARTGRRQASASTKKVRNTGPCAVHHADASASSARPIRDRSTPRSALVVGLAGLISTARSKCFSARSKHRRSK